MSLPRSLRTATFSCARYTLPQPAAHASRTLALACVARGCVARAYSSEFGSYEAPPNYATGEMGDEKPKKKPRAYARHAMVRERPSVLTQSDRSKLEFRKKVREGKTLDQYNATISDYIAREDTYEALVTLMDMYSTNTTPDVETFNILIFGHFRLKLPEKAIDLFIDLAPPEMKLDSSVYNRLVMELVKAKSYNLLGRLQFLLDPKDGKPVADVNISEMAVTWAHQFYPEMGNSEIQRVFGGYRPFQPNAELIKKINDAQERAQGKNEEQDEGKEKKGEARGKKNETKEKEKEAKGRAKEVLDAVNKVKGREEKGEKKEAEMSANKEGEEGEKEGKKEAEESTGKEEEEGEGEEGEEEAPSNKKLTKAELRNLAVKEKMKKLREQLAEKKSREEAERAKEGGEEEAGGTEGESAKRRPKRRV